jgi:hypothetical protein
VQGDVLFKIFYTTTVIASRKSAKTQFNSDHKTYQYLNRSRFVPRNMTSQAAEELRDFRDQDLKNINELRRPRYSTQLVSNDISDSQFEITPELHQPLQQQPYDSKGQTDIRQYFPKGDTTLVMGNQQSYIIGPGYNPGVQSIKPVEPVCIPDYVKYDSLNYDGELSQEDIMYGFLNPAFETQYQF